MFEQYIPNDYIRAFVLFIAIFLIIRILIFVLGKILPKLVSKTKTKIDDIILEKASFPLTLIALVVGVRVAIGELRLDESWNMTIEGAILTFVILVGSFLLYVILDTIITFGLNDLSTGGKKKRINESLVQFLHGILKFIIFIAALLMILASWGVRVGPLLAGLGVAGLAIAFALQSTLSNIFGGISMILDRSINVGDMVKLDENTSGIILKINLRSTKIRTFDNELIIVPNGKLAESNIQNVALPEPKTRVVVPFDVAYGSDVSKVKKVVLKEIEKITNVLDNPEPVVRFLEMADSSLKFKAFFYVKSFEDRMNAIDEANTLIYDTLNKNKISIPFPQVDVHMKGK